MSEAILTKVAEIAAVACDLKARVYRRNARRQIARQVFERQEAELERKMAGVLEPLFERQIKETSKRLLEMAPPEMPKGSKAEEEGRWVTTSQGNRLFIGEDGVARTGPGGKIIPDTEGVMGGDRLNNEEAEKLSSPSDWSKGEKNIVRTYVNNLDSYQINKTLRGQEPDRGTKEQWQEKANHLKDLIHQKANVPFDLQAVRRINVLGDEGKKAILQSFQDKVGKEFTDPAFVSTSASVESRVIGEDSPKSEWKSVGITVFVPKGAEAMYVPNKIAGRRKEYELIIQAGSRFRVRRVHENQVELELLK